MKIKWWRHLPARHSCWWRRTCPPCWTPLLCRSSRRLLLAESVWFLTPPTTPWWRQGRRAECWDAAAGGAPDRTPSRCRTAPPPQRRSPAHSSCVPSDWSVTRRWACPSESVCHCLCKWACPLWSGRVVCCGAGGGRRLTLTGKGPLSWSWLDERQRTLTGPDGENLRERWHHRVFLTCSDVTVMSLSERNVNMKWSFKHTQR